MKLNRIWIFCLLLAAGHLVHGQGSLTVSIGNTTTPCTPALARANTSPSCFVADSFSWGGSSSPTSQARVGADITKSVTGISTTLFMDMLQGKPIPKLVITQYETRPDADYTQYVIETLEFDNVYVSSESSSAVVGGGLPSEEIAIVFQKVAVTYFQWYADGAVSSTGALTYDQVAHKIL